MAWNKPTTQSRIKELKTVAAIQADPTFGPLVRNVAPFLGSLTGDRQRKKTLGTGTFGKVNLEEYMEGNVATKYFLDIEDSFCDSVGEIASLKYLQGKPNIVPFLSLLNENANTDPLNFPAIQMGKAVGDLYDNRLFNSWDDIYSACIQVLRGYYSLHSMGIAHRDTKPQNMLLTSYGEVWISDLGKSKYFDAFIPSPQDNYPGTYWYASPEGLMKWSSHPDKKPIDYFKQDCWAVGACLYNIVTGTPFGTGNTPQECIEALILRKGTPVPADGIVFTLYNSWPKKARLEADLLAAPSVASKTIAQHPDAVRQRVKMRARFLIAENATVVSQLADVISALMQYNPDRRPSIAETLQMPGMPGLPPAILRPIITAQYVEEVSLPSWVTDRFLDKLFNSIHSHSDIHSNPKSRPFVLDRTGMYVYSFLTLYKEDKFCKEKNFLLIGVAAYTIANCLFADNADEFTQFSFYNTIRKKYKEKKFNKCLRKFMMSDIDFYGRTFLDTLLQSQASPTPQLIETYGLLNYVCYQKNLFSKYAGKLDLLQDEILQFVKDGRVPSSKDLLSSVYFSGVGTGSKTDKRIQDFIDYVTPSEGGRRRYRKTRRVKRRKQNTTLKARNG